MRVLKKLQDTLPTKLSPIEFERMARELADTHERLSLEREAQKEQKAEMKLRVEELEQKRTRLARVVRDGFEPRLVDVEWHANDARGVVELVRMDTGEVYSQRALTETERQVELFAEPGDRPTATAKGSARAN